MPCSPCPCGRATADPPILKQILVRSYKSRFLQPLEKSSRQKPFQQAKTSSHWNNHPAKNVISIPKPPVTGRIQTPKPTLTDQFLPFTGRNTPLRTSPASQNLQPLEEMVTSGGSCCSLNLGRRKGGMYADLAGTGLVQRGRFG